MKLGFNNLELQTRNSKLYFGTRAPIRTEKKQFLKLPCLPVAPREHESDRFASLRTPHPKVSGFQFRVSSSL